MMKMDKNGIFGIGLFLFIILAIFFLFQLPQQDTQKENKDTISTTSPSSVGVFDEQGNPIAIETLPTATTSLPIAPKMSGAIVFPKTYPEENRAAVTAKINTLQNLVLKDPSNVSNWIEIGLYWKLLEDYKRAETAWLYATQISSQYHIPFGNLGFLYAYHLHNNVQAETYFLKAIEIAPEQIYLYLQTAEFYRDVVKDNSKAKNIIDRGIVANPKDQELKKFRQLLN